MKNVTIIVGLVLALTTSAFASGGTSDAQLDRIKNSTGGSFITVPSAGSVFATDSGTMTFTNKTIDGGSNTITGLTTSSLASGFTLGYANGGTNATTAAGAAANLLGSLSGSSTSGYFLEWNGSAFVFAAVPSMDPSLNGGSASPDSVTASVGVSLSSIVNSNEVWVLGSPGAVVVTATPSVTACSAEGQQLKIHGTSNTDTVKLQDQSVLASSGLYLNGPVTLGAQQSITLHCDMTLSAWVEDSRSN